MKKIAFINLFLFLSFNLWAQHTFIDERSAIVIKFSGEGKIFPAGWYSSSISPKTNSLSSREYSRSRNIILRALSKYPVEVIQKNINAVYVLHSLELYGQRFGGTNSSDTIYLSNQGSRVGYSDFYIEQLFHSEFSSILLRNYSHLFDNAKWESQNSSDFEYGKGGVDALKKGEFDETFNKSLNEAGLLNQYATSSLENDVNAFAKNLFLPRKSFGELIRNHERIQKKRKLLIKFYNQIDNSFTEELFDSSQIWN